MAKVILPAICLFLLIPIAALAQPHILMRGDFDAERVKTLNAADRVSASGATWYITIVSESEFLLSINKFQRNQSAGSCYTVLPARMTYCNASWVDKSTVEQVAHSLAHEFGHLLCNCGVEKRANDEARFLLH